MAIDTTNTQCPVLIVGAGPVGLFLALRLVQSGIPVTLIEANTALDNSTKAITHGPTIHPEYARAGILDDVLTAAGDLKNTGLCFRKTSDKSVVAKLQLPPGKSGPAVLPQREFCRILLAHLERVGGAEVLFGRRFEGMREKESGGVSVDTSSDGVMMTLDARFVVAADGGKSAVRKAAGIAFEGETLPAQLVVVDLHYPFEKHGWGRHDANFLVDPEHYGLVAPVDGKGLWRCSFGLPLKRSSGDGSQQERGMDEIQAAVPGKFESMLPSEPGTKPEGWELVNVAPYKAQQLCAKSMRMGSVILVGDAAHRKIQRNRYRKSR